MYKGAVCLFALSGLFAAAAVAASGQELPARTGRQWIPLEWSLENPAFEGNPFDLEAAVTFTHEESGERRTTGMFYDGGAAWKWRFTGTRPGRWRFTTRSSDPDLDGRTGAVRVEANPDAYGFVTHRGSRWVRPRGIEGRLEAFVPQFVMYDEPPGYYGRPEKIDADIETFLDGHGFTGFHTPVYCRWFDLEEARCGNLDDPDPEPDPRTFRALEELIMRVHAAGGVVHLWAWGDEARTMTPKKWGANGAVDRRLQRYIAARLGPLPGWTMGYGFDLWEWVAEGDLRRWHGYMHEQLGWPHMLGARSEKNRLTQLSEAMDYASYEQHRPDYEMYVETIERRPGKPAFSEDRFRIRDSDRHREKDYSMERTRRGLWHSAMAGGVANIWGNLLGPSGEEPSHGGSFPYPRPEWIQTYARFFEARFTLDLERCNDLTDGVCLKRPAGTHFLFYREEAESVRMDLSGMPGPQRAVAVDARRPYAEIDLGLLAPEEHTWKAPYPSDWAIAVGF